MKRKILISRLTSYEQKEKCNENDWNNDLAVREIYIYKNLLQSLRRLYDQSLMLV